MNHEVSSGNCQHLPANNFQPHVSHEGRTLIQRKLLVLILKEECHWGLTHSGEGPVLKTCH